MAETFDPFAQDFETTATTVATDTADPFAQDFAPQIEGTDIDPFSQDFGGVAPVPVQDPISAGDAIKRGLRDGINPFDPIDEKDRQAVKEHPWAYLGANVGSSAVSMLAIEGLLNMIPGGQAPALAAGAAKAKQANNLSKIIRAARPIANSAASVGLYTAAEGSSGRIEDGDKAKRIGTNMAVDIGANLLFRGGGKLLKNRKLAKVNKATDDLQKEFNKQVKEEVSEAVDKKILNQNAQKMGQVDDIYNKSKTEVIPQRTVPLKTFDETLGKTIDELPDDFVKLVDGKPKQVGSVNLDRIEGTDDMKNFLKASLIDNVDAINTKRRGVLTFDDIQSLANDVKVNPNKLKNNIGKAYSAEELLAYRDVLNKKTTDILDIKKLLDTPDGNNITNKARLAQLISEQRVMNEVVSAGSTEAGRALSAHRIMSKNLQEAITNGDVKTLEKVLARLNNGMDINDFIAKLDSFDNDIDRVEFLRSIYKPKAWDVIHSYWVNSILSNPTTHIVNNLSNLSVAMLRPLEAEVSGGLATVGSKLTGKTQKRFMGEGAIQMAGMASGFKKGIRKAMHVMKNGYSITDTTKIDLPRLSPFKGAFQVLEAPGRALVAADELLRSVNFDMAIRQSAFNAGKKANLKGSKLANYIGEFVNNPPVKAVKFAQDEAAYRLFQKEPNKLTTMITGIANKEVGDTGFRPLRFVIPFIQTPANILRFGIERTPLGLFKLGSKAKKGALNDDAAKVIVGSTLMAGAALMHKEGKITGAPPKDKVARDLLMATGWRPNSIRVGDTYVSYRRLEPYNQLFNMATTVSDVMGDKDDPRDVIEKTGVALHGIGSNFVDASYLSGLNNLFNAIDDPERYGNQFLNNIASGFVPFSGTNRGLVRITDPRYLNPQNVGQAIKGNIPGLSHSVPARVDALKNIRSADNKGMSALINPYQVSPLLVSEDELQNKIDMANKIENAKLSGKKLPKKAKKEVDRVLGSFQRYQDQELQKLDKIERKQNGS